MSDEKYAATMLLIGICVVILTIGGCETIETTTKTLAIRDMVKAGADPIESRCALNVDATLCAITAALKLQR